MSTCAKTSHQPVTSSIEDDHMPNPSNKTTYRPPHHQSDLHDSQGTTYPQVPISILRQNLDSIQAESLKENAQVVSDLAKGSDSTYYHQVPQPLSAVASSFLDLISNTAGVLIANPKAALKDPMNYFYALLAYGFVYTVLGAFTCFLITAHIFNLDGLMRFLSKTYTESPSITFWINGQILNDQTETFRDARRVLRGNIQDNTESPVATIQCRFNREVARVIMLMSTIIYERDIKEVKLAFACKDPEEASEHLFKSEARIYEFCATKLGCKFISITDFQTAQGPFAGAFYEIEDNSVPFIIIVFKGTSPEALSEWIVDASFNLETAAADLGGGFAHQGFYSSLFPAPEKKIQHSPYWRIVGIIKTIAKEALEKTKNKPNLFVGGHSLGAGLASLFYARLLESPEDLDESVMLRDAYCFGTPRVFGASLASRVERNLTDPTQSQRALWRVINQSWFPILPGDIVTRVPPGLGDATKARENLREGSLLSYAAVGIPVLLLPDGSQPFFQFGCFPEEYGKPSYTKIIKQLKEAEPWKGINKYVHIVFPIFHDHFPGCYFRSLNRISFERRPTQ